MRVATDSYYVRNWSVWLDVVILARAVTIVLRGRGAYEKTLREIWYVERY